MIALARSATHFPFKLTMPNSVITYITSERGVVTLLPGVTVNTMQLRRSLASRKSTKADERLASLGRIRAAHELQLPSRAADVAMAVGF